MKPSLILNITGTVIALFAIATLFMSISVIFDLFNIREKEGNYVLFVVVANFICALLYFPAAYGLFTRQKWTTLVLNMAVGVLVITFIGLAVYIFLGGVYEQQTVVAMIFRTLLTIGFTLISFKYLSQEKISEPSDNK